MPQANQAAPNPLFIKYPDGQVMASAMFVWNAAQNKFEVWDGTVTVGSVTSSGVIADGVDNTILASVINYIGGDATKKNPLVVQLVDLTGTPVNPPAAITNYALETGGNLATIAGKDFATQTTLSALNAKVTACNTGAVVISSSALPTLAATSTKQSDGSQKTQLVDGSGNVIGSTSNALDINIKSGNITGFATSALQTTGNTALTTINTTLGSPFQAGGALAANQTVNVAQINGVTPLMGAGNTGTGSPRVTISSDQVAIPVTISHGKSIKSVSGSLTSSTDIIAAVSSKRLKIFAYSLLTFGTSATTLIFKSNNSTEEWRVLTQAITGTISGANLALTVPSFIFATVAGEKLTLVTNTSDTIHYSVSYWDDDAT